MNKKIKCVIQRPGQLSEIINVEDNFFYIRDLLGGVPEYIKISDLNLSLIFISNNHFLPYNIYYPDKDIICGTVIIMKEVNDTAISMTISEIQDARSWLLNHTYGGKEHE